MNRPATPLLPCPFCGAAPEAEEFNDEEVHCFFVSCINHDYPASSVLASGDNLQEAAELWNTRNGSAA